MPNRFPGPPPWRGEIFFLDKTGQGFSETYWMSATDVNTAMTDLVALAAARQAMFDSQNRVLFWRVSDPNLKGDTLVQQADATTLGTYGQGTPPLVDMNRPEVGLKCRMQFADRYFGTRIFRMLPEDSVTDGFWTPTTAMDTAVTSLTTILKAKTTGLVRGVHEATPNRDYIIKALTGVIPLSVTTKKVGRPFGQRRGRSVLR